MNSIVKSVRMDMIDIFGRQRPENYITELGSSLALLQGISVIVSFFGGVGFCVLLLSSFAVKHKVVMFVLLNFENKLDTEIRHINFKV